MTNKEVKNLVTLPFYFINRVVLRIAVKCLAFGKKEFDEGH
jgi:hypothetical protein